MTDDSINPNHGILLCLLICLILCGIVFGIFMLIWAPRVMPVKDISFSKCSVMQEEQTILLAGYFIDDTIDRRAMEKEYQQLKTEINRIAESTNFNGVYMLNRESDVMVGRTTGSQADQTGSLNPADPSSFPSMPTPPADALVLDGITITSQYEVTQDTVIRGSVSVFDMYINPGVSVYIEEGATLDAYGGMFGIENGGTIHNSGTITSISTTLNTKQQFANEPGEHGVVINYADGRIESLVVNGNASTQVNSTPMVFNFGYIREVWTQDGSLYNFGTVNSVINGVPINTAAVTAVSNFGIIQSLTNLRLLNHYGDPANIVMIMPTSSGTIIYHPMPDTFSLPAVFGSETKSSSMQLTSAIILQIGDTTDEFNKLYVRSFDMRCTNLGSSSIKLIATEITAWEKANEATFIVKEAISQASSARAYYGAVQNRLEHTINSLDSMVENLTASESRIRDTDVAKEMMAYVKNGLILQSAQAMLAQANLYPQHVLKLI